jgi:polyisoprenoid-binding protein YceI
MPSLPPALRRHRFAILAAVVVVLLVAVVGPFVYTHLINDPADKASVDDIRISTTTTAHGPSDDGASTTSDPGGSTGDASGIDGTWTVQRNDQAFAGYRVKEVLFGQDTEAVGRTEDVTGTLTASGTTITAVDITVDMTSVTSDESRRDGQFRGRIMSTDQFPTATFRLTKPIELGTLPAEGAIIQAEATGDLTLRGVTRSVTIPLTAKHQGDTLVVQGLGDISFDDFDIPDATFGPATVGRTGQVELLLVFTR